MKTAHTCSRQSHLNDYRSHAELTIIFFLQSVHFVLLCHFCVELFQVETEQNSSHLLFLEEMWAL